MVDQNLWTILPAERFYYDVRQHLLQFSGAINPPSNNIFDAFSVILPNSDARLVRFWQEASSNRYMVSAVPLADIMPILRETIAEVWTMLYLIVPLNEQKAYTQIESLLISAAHSRSSAVNLSYQIKMIIQSKPANIHPLFNALVCEVVNCIPLLIGLNGDVAAIHRFFAAFFSFVREFSCSDNFVPSVDNRIAQRFTDRVLSVPAICVLHQI